MKVLVTGAHGFIGSELIKALLQNPKNEVYGLGRSLSCITKPNYSHIQADMYLSDFISKLPESMEVIIHTAQSSRYREFPAQSDDLFQINTRATVDLLNYGRKSGVVKFLYTSSGNVYAPSVKKHTETSPCYPGSFYAATKLASENLMMPYSAFFDINILRIFSAYGPGQKVMLIPNMIQAVKEGKEILLAKGKGLVLTPIYIDDLVNLFLVLLKTKTENSIQLFNVSGSEEISLDQIVQRIASFFNVHPNCKQSDNEPTWLLSDNRKIIEYTQYKEFTKFAEGLDLVLQKHA